MITMISSQKLGVPILMHGWMTYATQLYQYVKMNVVFQDGLDFIAHWNMSMLQSEDLMKAAVALISKDDEPPEFSKL